jgi:protein transport protein SEC20
MKANADVTEALRRTIGLMQNELERSVLSVQMLGTSIILYPIFVVE